MTIHENDIINQFFNQSSLNHPQDYIQLGIGDDAALSTLPPDTELATSIDTSVSGIHFLEDTPPQDIAYKSMAVSFSDIAAMGAKPSSALLSLTLPKVDKKWLTDFSSGLFDILNTFQVPLIGGDTTRGPLSITTVVNGFVPQGKAIHRCGAQPGDLIYVSNTLGDACLCLRWLREKSSIPDPKLLKKLRRPNPCIQLGMALRNLAHAAIDISDGLAIDLEKILTASRVGATIELNKLPLSDTLLAHYPKEKVAHFALVAGDDYELCFTISENREKELHRMVQSQNLSVTCIGKIQSEKGLRVINASGNEIDLKYKGYQAF